MSQTENLADKHRPLMFRDVIGQPMVKKLALNIGANPTTAGDQAYLMTGLHGSGKTTTARIMARALNCDKLGEDGEPCDPADEDNLCQPCQLLLGGAWGEGIKEIDAASNNGVDSIRDLTNVAALSTRAKRLVVIIDEVHALTTAAQQAFLKTLEEPGRNVTWVLCTTDPQRLSDTIRSRCVEIHMNALNDADLMSVLEKVITAEGWDVSEDDMRKAILRGQGSSRKTINSLQEVMLGASVDDFTIVYKRVDDAIASRDVSAVTIELEAVMKESTSFSLLNYVQHLMETLRGAMLLQANEDSVSEHHEFYDQVVGFADNFSQQKIIRGIRHFYEAMSPMGIAGRNAHGILQGAILVFIQPTAGSAIEQVLDALEDLADEVRKLKASSITSDQLSQALGSIEVRATQVSPSTKTTPVQGPSTDDPWVDPTPAESSDLGEPESEEAEETTEEDEPEQSSESPDVAPDGGGDTPADEEDDGDESEEEEEEEDEDEDGPELSDQDVYDIYDDMLGAKGIGKASRRRLEDVEDEDINIVRKRGSKIVSKVVVTLAENLSETTQRTAIGFFSKNDLKLEFKEQEAYA